MITCVSDEIEKRRQLFHSLVPFWKCFFFLFDNIFLCAVSFEMWIAQDAELKIEN